MENETCKSTNKEMETSNSNIGLGMIIGAVTVAGIAACATGINKLFKKNREVEVEEVKEEVEEVEEVTDEK